MQSSRRTPNRPARRAVAALAFLTTIGFAPVPVAGAATGAVPATVGLVDPPSAPSSSPTPKSAVQTAAGKVKVIGSPARGTTKLRLLQDDTVVAEVRAGTSTVVFERTGVAAGAHTYSLQAGNAGGWAPEGSEVALTVVDVPGAATLPTVTQTTDTGASVTFDRVATATSYVVLANGTAVATVKPRVGTDPVVKRISSLTRGSTYSITVAAVNVAGTGAPSPAASFTAHAQMKRVPAPTVKDGTVQTGAGAVRVVAKATPGAASHALVVDGSVVGATPTVADGKVRFDVTGLDPGAHTFAVRATNPGYTSTSAAVTVEVLTTPSAATGLSIQQTSDTLAKLTFTPGADSTSAKVHLDGTQVADAKVPKGATSVTVTLPAMVALSSHSVTVTGVNVVGSAAASAPLAFTLHPALTTTVGQPTAVQTGDGEVRVTITTTPNATTYQLLQDGVKVADATASAGSVRFDVADLTPGSRYVFEVVAKNPRNSAARSKFVNITVVPVLAAGPDVTGAHVYGAGDTVTVTLSLAPTAGANGYRVRVDGVVTTTRYEPLALTVGRATISLSLDSTVDHTVDVVAFNTMGSSPASDAYEVPADPG